MTTSSQSSQGGYTKIEQSIRAALLQRGDQFNQITKSAWYFVVSFDDVRAGVPYGRLPLISFLNS